MKTNNLGAPKGQHFDSRSALGRGGSRQDIPDAAAEARRRRAGSVQFKSHRKTWREGGTEGI